MVKNLNHLERAAAALADEEVDRLATYPKPAVYRED